MWHVTHHTDICHSPLTTLDLGNDKNIIKTIGLKQFKAVTACQIKTLLAELNKCRTSPVHETLFAIVILNRFKRFRKMNWLNKLEHFSFSPSDIWYRCWVLLEFKLRENWTWRNPGRSVYFPWAWLGAQAEEKCWNAQSKL